MHLSDKFESWKGHLFNILYYDYYRKYVLTNRPVQQPELCTDTANSIMNTGQVVRAWFEERVVQDPTGLLTLGDAKRDFYDCWICTTGQRCDGIKLHDLKEQLNGLLNMCCQKQMCNALTNNVKLTNVWKGFRLQKHSQCYNYYNQHPMKKYNYILCK